MKRLSEKFSGFLKNLHALLTEPDFAAQQQEALQDGNRYLIKVMQNSHFVVKGSALPLASCHLKYYIAAKDYADLQTQCKRLARTVCITEIHDLQSGTQLDAAARQAVIAQPQARDVSP